MDYNVRYFLSPTVKKAIELKSRGVKMLPSKDTNHKNAVCKYFLMLTRFRFYPHYICNCTIIKSSIS